MPIEDLLKDPVVLIEYTKSLNEYFNFILMKIWASLMLIFSLFSCHNEKSKADDQLRSTDSIPVSVQLSLDEKRLVLIETVLNLPDVIRFSKVEFIRKKYGKIFILLNDFDSKDNIPLIMQSSKSLHVLYSADSITEEMPCYIFDKIEIRGDSANILLKFDLTGAIAFGNLTYANRQWVPDEDFFVGVR